MRHCLITFRSVTPAQKAQRILQQAGYACMLHRTPRWMEEKGCGYSLRVPLTDASACVRLLQEGMVAYRKVYLQHSDGRTEELVL